MTTVCLAQLALKVVELASSNLEVRTLSGCKAHSRLQTQVATDQNDRDNDLMITALNAQVRRHVLQHWECGPSHYYGLSFQDIVDRHEYGSGKLKRPIFAPCF